jgi:hypothetical protein
MPILLCQLFPQSGVLPSIVYQLMVYLFVALTMPFLGQYMDTTNRWTVIRTSLLLKNILRCCSALSFAGLAYQWMYYDDDDKSNNANNNVEDARAEGFPMSMYLPIGVMLAFSALSHIYRDLQILALEKDWVIEVSHSTQTPLLDWNIMMRRIHLVTRFVAPVLCSFLEQTMRGIDDDEGGNKMIVPSTASTPATRFQALVLVTAIAFWNLLIYPLEYAALADIYAFCPSLQNHTHSNLLVIAQDTTRTFVNHPMFLHHIDLTKNSMKNTMLTKLLDYGRTYVALWSMFARHPTCILSLSFSALSMTMQRHHHFHFRAFRTTNVSAAALFDFESLTTTSMSIVDVSIVVFGWIGTIIFPLLLRRCRSRAGSPMSIIERVSVVCIWLYVLSVMIPSTVLLAIASSLSSSSTRSSSSFIDDDHDSSHYLLWITIVVSSLWFCCIDLAETQILQEWVETEYRGTINALQESASKAFAVVFLSMLLFMIPVVSYDESFDDLHALMMLVTVSIMTTVVAAFGFTWWYYRYCNEGWYRGIE